ncbi:hypothetical protein GOV04_01910 [Candidatus Woesearchaeota archaeon]|nr:hypothetical protein [Candidatus Woesearchaeota archaeon]
MKKLQISEINAGQTITEVTVNIVDVAEPREFQKFGKQGRVATATVKDSSGQCKLTLWNEQIDQVKAGDTVKITNGYAREWQSEVQITTGKNGTLEVVGSAEAAAQPTADAETTTEDSSKEDEEKLDVEEETIE